MYLGIDIGGTFTDLVLMDEGGNISTAKAPTTPGELEKGVFDAVAVAANAQGLGPEELLSRVTAFGHGTTQATNALIERTGATTGLINRVVAVGRTRKPSIRKPSAVSAPKPERRRMFEPTTLAWTEADIFQWLDMPAGFRVSGPAVVEHPETTVY